MPKRPARNCAQPGCPNLVATGTRCYKHQLPRAVDGRPSAATRGYGAAWSTIRAKHLADHPYCADPSRRHASTLVNGSHVDHIRPLSAGGSHAASNLQTLCHACHNYKTAHDGSRKGREVKKFSYGGRDRRGSHARTPAKFPKALNRNART